MAMNARRLTFVTFFGLTAVLLLVGGVASVLLKGAIRHTVLDLQMANSKEYGRRFAQAIEMQLEAGDRPEIVLWQVQRALDGSPPDTQRFLCVLSDDAMVLCHPNESLLGKRAETMTLRRLGNGETFLYSAWVRAGGEEALLLDSTGSPVQLVRRIPVNGAQWSVLVHTRLDVLDQAVAKLNRTILMILLPTGVLIVLVGTFVVRLLGRGYEEVIEEANTGLEERVSERTAQLEKTVAELQATRDALLLKEKVALLGTLVAGIAHEIKNPLAAIQLISESLSEYEEDPDVRDGLKKIHSSARRCNQLVANLLSFARNEPPRRVAVSVHRILDTATSLTNPQFRRAGVTLEKRLNAGNPTLMADPIQLEQVVLNLLGNAAQELESRPEPRTVLIESRLEGDVVVLAVEDNGRGVDPSIRERLFEPFQTTKPDGEGTGLGLSLCKRFVESHEGTITYAEGASGGARFEIRLPLPFV